MKIKKKDGGNRGVGGGNGITREKCLFLLNTIIFEEKNQNGTNPQSLYYSI